MKKLIDHYDFILAEAAVVERLRRNDKVSLDDKLVHGLLIYDTTGRVELLNIYNEYINIANEYDIPIMLSTPTWRTNKERVKNSGICSRVNVDAVHFLLGLKRSLPDKENMIKVGGLIGCKNDCYLPGEGLTSEEAEEFHSWQINELVLGGVEYLIAVTLPNVEEALGIAKAMEKTGVPYILSFVIDKDGIILDGTRLDKAITYIDSLTIVPPLGYFINCSYPSFVNPAIESGSLFDRLLGIQANASSLDHQALEGASEIQSESTSSWGSLMLNLNETYGVKVLGGCCGTTGEHLHYIAANKALQQTSR
ncbi:MAG: homocysteine S-methyltransferase family protein [Gammaproteobacteria bacterium]|nr:homocysteine S-methyltransferase family protein [Gammaproteobacteria bacterium]